MNGVMKPLTSHATQPSRTHHKGMGLGRHARRVLHLVLLLAVACPVLAGSPDSLRARAQAVFAPLPQDMATADHPITPELVALGRKLFFDTRLSVDGKVGCVSCHDPAHYGTDGLPKSIGANQTPNARNAPTVFNAALQIAQHWYGDRRDVEDQAQKSLTGKASFRNPDEPSVVEKLKALGYEQAFAAAFPGMTDPVGSKQAGAAIGAFERTLTTPAPFDRYLQGDDQALSKQAKAGLGLFMDLGCATCHRGAGVGGEVFQRFGLYGNYWEATGSKPIDQGRMADTKNPADQYVFKVPLLRNVTKTAPYFHDGSVQSLPEAVAIMAKLQLGKTLAPKETAELVAFLSSLTGAVPQAFAPPQEPMIRSTR